MTHRELVTQIRAFCQEHNIILILRDYWPTARGNFPMRTLMLSRKPDRCAYFKALAVIGQLIAIEDAAVPKSPVAVLTAGWEWALQHALLKVTGEVIFAMTQDFESESALLFAYDQRRREMAGQNPRLPQGTFDTDGHA